MARSKPKLDQFPAQTLLKNMHRPYLAQEYARAYWDGVFMALSTSQDLWKACTDIRKEVQQNCSRMMGKEAKMAQKAATCKSWEELSSIQTKAIEKCMGNYLAESQKLSMIFFKDFFPGVRQPDLVKSQLVVE